MIKCIMFDMIGVLAITREDGLNVEEEKIISAKEKYIFDEEYYEYMENEFPELNEEQIRELVMDTTFKSLRPMNLDIIGKINELDENIEFGVITNHISVAKQWLEENFPYGLDNIYTSGDIGLAKPSEYFYEYVAKDLCMKPEEILFIDDNIRNVEAAIEAG
ncbi:MAG: HAD-IA family hydrolase, partial [Clostridia bacterium]